LSSEWPVLYIIATPPSRPISSGSICEHLTSKMIVLPG